MSTPKKARPPKYLIMTFLRVSIVVIVALFFDFLFIGSSIFGSRGMITSSQVNSRALVQERYIISEYDHVMRAVAQELDMDWRLLAAIGYHESRFRDDVSSHVGAVGVMQVMPKVARGFGVSETEIKDPETNIRVAGKLLRKIESSLRLDGVDDQARMRVVLACYNGGIGHVLDARRLAAKHGVNYNSWSELSRYLKIKGSDEYVDDEAVRSGPFKGNQTVAFVNNVMNRYELYCRTTTL